MNGWDAATYLAGFGAIVVLRTLVFADRLARYKHGITLEPDRMPEAKLRVQMRKVAKQIDALSPYSQEAKLLNDELLALKEQFKKLHAEQGKKP